MFYSWTTTKTATGYRFTVTENTPTKTADANGRYCRTLVVKTANGFRSRAQAKRTAQKWCRYFAAVAA